MIRHQDWPTRLVEYIEQSRTVPFAYGSHDCCQFAAKAVAALTGENPAAAWHYTNEIGAARLIVEAGGLEALITTAMGEPIHPSQAGRGDVVLADLELGPTIGVCLGRTCAFATDPVGVVFRPRAAARMAWRV